MLAFSIIIISSDRISFVCIIIFLSDIKFFYSLVVITNYKLRKTMWEFQDFEIVLVTITMIHTAIVWPRIFYFNDHFGFTIIDLNKFFFFLVKISTILETKIKWWFSSLMFFWIRLTFFFGFSLTLIGQVKIGPGSSDWFGVGLIRLKWVHSPCNEISRECLWPKKKPGVPN